MSYQIALIDDDDELTEIAQCSSDVAQLLNGALKQCQYSPIGDWDDERCATKSLPLARAIRRLLEYESLFNDENSHYGDYEEVTMLAMKMWHACRLNPNHRLSICF